MGDGTLQHICKAHKIHHTETNLAKELQLPTLGKQSFNLGRQKNKHQAHPPPKNST
jgi:hypothetical protein